MSGDSEDFMVGLGIVGFIAIIVLLTSIVWIVRMDLSHEALGAKGRACFANHTCREGLHCLVADGIEAPGVCVK